MVRSSLTSDFIPHLFSASQCKHTESNNWIDVNPATYSVGKCGPFPPNVYDDTGSDPSDISLNVIDGNARFVSKHLPSVQPPPPFHPVSLTAMITLVLLCRCPHVSVSVSVRFFPFFLTVIFLSETAPDANDDNRAWWWLYHFTTLVH